MRFRARRCEIGSLRLSRSFPRKTACRGNAGGGDRTHTILRSLDFDRIAPLIQPQSSRAGPGNCRWYRTKAPGIECSSECVKAPPIQQECKTVSILSAGFPFPSTGMRVQVPPRAPSSGLRGNPKSRVRYSMDEVIWTRLATVRNERLFRINSFHSNDLVARSKRTGRCATGAASPSILFSVSFCRI